MNQKVALVTGSSRGIGRSIAIKLAESGYDILINCRTLDPNNHEKGAQEVRDRIHELGREAYICAADISKTEERKVLFREVDRIGRVDMLVNNAGIEPPLTDLLFLPEGEIERVLRTNLMGPYYITQGIARRMLDWKAQGVIEKGRIAFITSIQSQRVSGGCAYCISKIALHNLAQQFAIRLGEADIPVVEFVPGVFPTDMSGEHQDDITAKLENGWALTRRWGKLDEIGNMVAAMGRGLFDYSTGSSVEMSGGMNVFQL